jgi:hypothetical protein
LCKEEYEDRMSLYYVPYYYLGREGILSDKTEKISRITYIKEAGK